MEVKVTIYIKRNNLHVIQFVGQYINLVAKHLKE